YCPARASSAIFALCAAKPCADDGVPRQTLTSSAKHTNAHRLPVFIIVLARGPALQHDPEKWTPVFRTRSCSNKKIERDDDSKKSHLALGRGNVRGRSTALARYGLARASSARPTSILRNSAGPVTRC